MLETWIPNLIFVKCLGALCLDASRGVGIMPNFEKHYFVLWWNIILLYLQPSGLSSAIWGFTEPSALFSPGESLRDNQVSVSVPQILLLPRIKNPRLFQSCWTCTFTLYMLSLWNPVLWLNVLCSFLPFICAPTVTSWEMSCGLSWNTWLEVLWQMWWQKLAWMKARLQLSAVR